MGSLDQEEVQALVDQLDRAISDLRYQANDRFIKGFSLFRTDGTGPFPASWNGPYAVQYADDLMRIGPDVDALIQTLYGLRRKLVGAMQAAASSQLAVSSEPGSGGRMRME